MLLAIDIGNTNTVLGIFEGSELIEERRIRTVHDMTEDEHMILIRELFSGGKADLGHVTEVIISCVVPPMLNQMEEFCAKYLSLKPFVVDPQHDLGMPIHYRNPGEVGADRIVNGIAAFEKFKGSVIVVDFGTATTFDYIATEGHYIGGLITPGIMISMEALFHKASKLPRPDIFQPPYEVVGRDTVSSMRAGIIFGYAGVVDGIVGRIKEEVGTDPGVVATGGLARLIGRYAESIDEVDENLTLRGLQIIHQRLKEQYAHGRPPSS